MTWVLGLNYHVTYVESFNVFSAATPDNELRRDERAPHSVTSDKERGSSDNASLTAEINALDFSDDVTSVTADRTGENPALYWLLSSRLV